MKWNMIPLGDIALRRGSSVNPKKHQGEVFELYSIPAFDAGAPEVVAGSSIGSPKKAVQPNDVMISRIVPHIRRACVVGPANRHRQIASSEWIVFRDERVWPNYLRWLLVGDVFHSAFMRTVSGVGGSLLRARPAEVFKIKIPLPSLVEQRRIAGILDAADALRAKRRESSVKLERLLRSVFLDMFGDPVTNPKGWEFRELSETKSRVQIGPFGSLLHKKDYIVDGVPVVNPMHIVSGRIRVRNEQTVSEQKAATLSNYRLQTGDVVMGRRGEMGRCAIVSDTEAGMLCGTGSLFVRPQPEKLSSLFLARTLSSESMKRHLEGLSQGVTMPNLNRTMIEELKIGLPPLDLQERFATIVKSVEQQKALQRAHLTELNALFTSLQSRAFCGGL